MSAAWRLSELGYPVTVLERDEAVGGMGKTITVGGTTPSTSARTPSTSARPTRAARVLEAIKPFFGQDPLILTRGTRVLLRGKEYVYPLELHAGAHRRQPAAVAADRLRLPVATIKSTFSPPKKEDSFEEWGVRNLGRTLYDLCFGIYSARVWGLPTGQISSKQAQRVAKLNLKNIILRALGIKRRPGHLLHEVHVSAAGHQRALREHGDGSPQGAATASFSTRRSMRLERDGDRIARVVYRDDGREQTLDVRRRAVHAAAAGAGVDMITPPLPAPIVEHAARLRYRSLKLIYIALKRPQLTDYHWVYLLDEHFRVNRLSEQKNVSPHMVPPDRTMLCIELSCGGTSRCGRRATRRSTSSR